jgi:O-acetyl-ADP-ribose deacetylase (regulator of RNase III)
MIVFKEGSIFDSKAQTITNAVNCVGVMGKGLALDFKNRFPEMFTDYTRRCKNKEVALGRPYLYVTQELPWILNFPTKDHWRNASNLQDIIDGLEFLQKEYRNWGISSLAIPALGCGLGGLKWEVVARLLHDFSKNLEIPVEVYVPMNTSASTATSMFAKDNAGIREESGE